MIKIPMPTKDIPSDPNNLSPALASMAAQILTPNSWARVMGDAVASVNEKCPSRTNSIDK